MNEENKELNSKELYDLKKRKKDKANKKDLIITKVSSTSKKIVKYTLYMLITAGVIGGIGWLVYLSPNLPPTAQENHSEDSPSSHILTTKIPDAIQRHMLEHSDGSGPSGIIIQYNCDDYSCEPDLIQKLMTLVEEYPENVYLSPNNYDGKIILTKLGRIEILDEFDEQKIRDFIR